MHAIMRIRALLFVQVAGDAAGSVLDDQRRCPLQVIVVPNLRPAALQPQQRIKLRFVLQVETRGCAIGEFDAWRCSDGYAGLLFSVVLKRRGRCDAGSPA